VIQGATTSKVQSALNMILVLISTKQKPNIKLMFS